MARTKTSRKSTGGKARKLILPPPIDHDGDAEAGKNPKSSMALPSEGEADTPAHEAPRPLLESAGDERGNAQG